VLADLRKEGMTDYYATALPSLTGEKLLASYHHAPPGGFTDPRWPPLRACSRRWGALPR
jgi:hypothetical protein